MICICLAPPPRSLSWNCSRFHVGIFRAGHWVVLRRGKLGIKELALPASMVCDQFYVCVYVFFCKADFCAVDHCGSSKFKFKKLVALGVAAPCSWYEANF